MMQMALDIIQ